MQEVKADAKEGSEEESKEEAAEEKDEDDDIDAEIAGLQVKQYLLQYTPVKGYVSYYYCLLNCSPL